jgi:hypothetical protein
VIRKARPASPRGPFSFAKGETAMARRKQAIERVPVDVRLWTSERVAQAIKEVAMEEDRSMSQLIRHWVHEALRARGVALSADESHILTSGCPIWAPSSSPNAA